MPDPLFQTILTLCGLNGLRKKGCHIFVKKIFDDPFHKKLPVLVILVPVMIRPSGLGSFLGKLDFRGCWGHWGCRGCWGQRGWRGFQGLEIHYCGLHFWPEVIWSWGPIIVHQHCMGGAVAHNWLLRSHQASFLTPKALYDARISNGLSFCLHAELQVCTNIELTLVFQYLQTFLLLDDQWIRAQILHHLDSHWHISHHIHHLGKNKANNPLRRIQLVFKSNQGP